jgi:hypothetical protein
MTNLSLKLFSVSLLIASMTSQLLAAFGPTSTLYVTNYGEFSGGAVTGLDLIQGAGVSSYPTSDQLGINIAVSGDVRTMGYSTSDTGSRYDLAANPLPGGPYTNFIPLSQLHDGTSDGSYNYTVNYTTGDVLQFDRNWANPVVLFNATPNVPGAGWITMNVVDGSFWLSQWGGPDVVGHYSSTGTYLGGFNLGFLGSVGLALDPVDGTLWTGDGSFKLHQYSQAGAPLQTTTPYALQGSWYGMEFNTAAVPEASSGYFAAIVIAGLAAWKLSQFASA